MIEKTIKDFIINGAYFDVENYRKTMKAPVKASYEENQWSYIIEIMILTIKSLKPSLKDDGNIIDYKRFKSELELWTSYRHGMNKNLLHGINGRFDENYFKEIDESIYSRLAIITLANQNWETVKEQIIENILFTSGNIELILESLLLSRILFSILKNKDFEYENILEELKYESINLTQVELSNYDKFYRVSKDKYDKDYKIEFERMRIQLITLLNGIELEDKFVTLRTCLKLLKNKQEESIERSCSTFFTCGVLGVVNEEVESNEIKDIRFLESLCSYVSKLRKGRIDIDDLDVTNYSTIDIFSYDENEVFSHPLLNQSKVIYKGQREKFEVAYVQTRTGIYRFVNVNKN